MTHRWAPRGTRGPSLRTQLRRARGPLKVTTCENCLMRARLVPGKKAIEYLAANANGWELATRRPGVCPGQVPT